VLSGAAALKDGDAVLELAGSEYVARAAFSSKWQLRDAAIGWLLARAKDGTVRGGSMEVCVRGRRVRRGACRVRLERDGHGIPRDLLMH
jgi:hypothetical protein